MDQLFIDIPSIKSKLIVYRGIKSDYKSVFSYTSATYNFNTAHAFAAPAEDGCILKIKIPIGAKILPLENISASKDECEILLSRYSKFDITDIYVNKKIKTYELEMYFS